MVTCCEKPGDSTCSCWMMHAADADDHAACVGCLDSFRHLGPPRTPSWRCSWTPCCWPMASARRTPPWEGGRVQNIATWRFPQTDRYSSVSQFRCLTVYPNQKTPHNLVCLLIFVLINKIGRPHQNCSMSILHYSWGALFRRVQLKYNLIVINQLFNCTHSSSTVL